MCGVCNRAKDATQSQRDQLPSSLLQLYRLLRNPLGVKPRKLLDPQALPGDAEAEDADRARGKRGKKKRKKGRKKRGDTGGSARLSKTHNPRARRGAQLASPQRPASAGDATGGSEELQSSLSVLRGHSRGGDRTARSGMEASSRVATPGKKARSSKKHLTLPGPVDKYGGTMFRDRTTK